MNDSEVQHPALTPEQRSRLNELSAAAIGDVMQRLGVVHSSISPVWAGARVVGPALTVLTAAGDNQVIHSALDLAAPDEVIVINGFGDETRALIGDLICEKARSLNISGFVVDGCVRDAEALASIPMPVFARGVTPAGPYKNGPGRLNVPIAVGGIAVIPGDVVVGDADGVVVIPRAELDAVIELAEAKLRAEDEKRTRLRRERSA